METWQQALTIQVGACAGHRKMVSAKPFDVEVAADAIK